MRELGLSNNAYAVAFTISPASILAGRASRAVRVAVMAGIAAGLGATQMPCGSTGGAINGSLLFRANVDVGLGVGIAGIGVAAAYIWSIRAARLANRPPGQLPV